MTKDIETLKREIKHLPPLARERAERELGLPTSPRAEHKVFVYGTLLTGEGNAHWAKGARRHPAWTHGTIYDTGFGFPAFVKAGETKIVGELLTVDDDLLSFTVQKRLLLAIVSGGHHVGSEFFGCFQEGVEFDFAVAEDVRVRGPAF